MARDFITWRGLFSVLWRLFQEEKSYKRKRLNDRDSGEWASWEGTWRFQDPSLLVLALGNCLYGSHKRRCNVVRSAWIIKVSAATLVARLFKLKQFLLQAQVSRGCNQLRRPTIDITGPTSVGNGRRRQGQVLKETTIQSPEIRLKDTHLSAECHHLDCLIRR